MATVYLLSDKAAKKHLRKAGCTLGTANSTGSEPYFARISGFKPNPLKYLDPDGRKLEIVVSKKNGTLTTTYTPDKSYDKIGNLDYFTSAKTISFSVVTNVVSGTPDNTQISDTSRFQDSSGGTTNPTQITNGTYNIAPRQASEGVNSGPLYKYGEPNNNGFLIDVTQMLPDVETGELFADSGYMIHITPNSFTDGCIGIPYNKNESWSRSAAQGKLNTLMSWYWVAKDRNEKATITITD
jgi:Flp pilus assembly protein TadG